jgi:hypothetical protein
MKKLYISYDHEDNVTSLLLSDSREHADLIWIGMGVAPHRVEEIDPSDDKCGRHGVAIILSPEVVMVKIGDDYRSSRMVFLKRGQ